MTECIKCGRKYTYVKSKGHTKTVCNSCTVNSRRIKLKEKAREYLGGKCCICGYSKCSRALSFHHKDRATKSFGITNSYMRSWLDLKKELKKCILVCANCHMEIESGLIKLNN